MLCKHDIEMKSYEKRHLRMRIFHQNKYGRKRNHHLSFCEGKQWGNQICIPHQKKIPYTKKTTRKQRAKLRKS